MSSVDLNALQALYAEATPGSWAADHDCEYSEGDAMAYVHLASDGAAHIGLFDTLNSDVRRIEREDDEHGSSYRDAQGIANMELVAALHEAAPRMIAELRAARAWAAKVRRMIDGDWDIAKDGWVEEFRAYERARDGEGEH